ncbi:MAG: adenine deaminase, partial [Dehalococcoidia bacterium]|nr:adenine deaminase [Dehalococcoidia bacterium]
CKHLPMDTFLMMPSCVPSTNMETAGAVISSTDMQTITRWEETAGLGEVMNFPGVIAGDEELLQKIFLAESKIIDGHAPGLSGKELQAYIAAGIYSDHECVTLREAQEKLKRGMYIMIREGSSEKNLEALLSLVNDATCHRCFFVVDDRNPSDLLTDGDIDAVVRKAIALGLEPIRAIQMATINTANYFHLNHMGAIAPGYDANLIILDELSSLRIEKVIYHGEVVAEKGKLLPPVENADDSDLRNTVNIGSLEIDALKIYVEQWHYPTIEIIPGQIITNKIQIEARTDGKLIVSDTDRDILKIAVIERHKASGNIGLGLVKGFGLKSGALASSVAHDSHNIVAVGVDDRAILLAVKAIEKLGGGLVATTEDKVIANLPLPVAGLLSKDPLDTVVDELIQLQQAAGDLGCSLPAPFAILSFLALPVIPELRITDKGLVDVNTFRLLAESS